MICVLLLHIKVIRSCLTSQTTFVLKFRLLLYFVCTRRHNFLMEKFTITEEPVVLSIKAQIFDELQFKQISLNVTDFLQVNDIFGIPKKTVSTVFLALPTVLKVFIIKKRTV